MVQARNGERLGVFHTRRTYVSFSGAWEFLQLALFFRCSRRIVFGLVSSPGPFLAGAFDRRSWLLTAGLSAIVAVAA